MFTFGILNKIMAVQDVMGPYFANIDAVGTTANFKCYTLSLPSIYYFKTLSQSGLGQPIIKKIVLFSIWNKSFICNYNTGNQIKYCVNDFTRPSLTSNRFSGSLDSTHFFVLRSHFEIKLSQSVC